MLWGDYYYSGLFKVEGGLGMMTHLALNSNRLMVFGSNVRGYL